MRPPYSTEELTAPKSISQQSQDICRDRHDDYPSGQNRPSHRRGKNKYSGQGNQPIPLDRYSGREKNYESERNYYSGWGDYEYNSRSGLMRSV